MQEKLLKAVIVLSEFADESLRVIGKCCTADVTVGAAAKLPITASACSHQ
jgi:hypothetical protein